MITLTEERIQELADMLRVHGSVRVRGMEQWIDPSLRGRPEVSCDMGRSQYGNSISVTYCVGDLAPETPEEVLAAIEAERNGHRAAAQRIAENLSVERENQR